MKKDSNKYAYGAKTGYAEYQSAQTYEERLYYKGFLGAIRKHGEVKIITSYLNHLPENSVVLDCPCGNGRWFETIMEKAIKIVAIDVSPGMIKYAKDMIKQLPYDIKILEGDAENLPLDSGSVDYVFSYALMKHLPIPKQFDVLYEFSRVSRKGVICSFAIFNLLSFQIWKARKFYESYPIWRHEIEWMANHAGLKVVKVNHVTSFIGLEHLVHMEKHVNK